ncbi:MAG: PAS domain S-box protein [Limisphaerales bacterium]
MPPLPANEKHRLEVLWDFAILDTPPEAEFDTLTQLAAQICQTPVALVSLIDQNRQWFKAKTGTEIQSTTREHSFCSHTILQTDLLIVPDATQDPRFSQSPLVTSNPGFRFYAGMPLVTQNNAALGTLCVLDYSPRDLNQDQQEALRLIANLVLRRLNAHRLLKQASQSTQQTAELAKTTAELETETVRRRQAEEETRRYNDITRNIHLGILVWQLNSPQAASLQLVTANPAAARILGFPIHSLIGKSIFELFPKFAETSIAQRFAEVVHSGQTKDLGCITYEDERIPRRDFSVRAFPLPDQCVGIVIDNVTDQRLAEQAQIEAQARKAAILDSAPDAIVTIDHEGKIFEWNAAAERIFGHRRSAVLGKTLASLAFNPASAHRFNSAMELAIRTGETAILGRRIELTGKRADNSEFPAELSVARVPRSSPPVFTGFLRDITERKRFEEALRASQSLYSSLVESLPQNVFRKDSHSRLTFANGRFCTTMGKRLEDIIGRTDEEFFPANIAKQLRREDHYVLEKGDTHETTVELPLPQIGPRHIQIVRSPIYNASGSLVGIQGMFWDVTERVQLENQLRQAQKMETVGQLAGGVAHDFNNLLTVIQGHAEILRALNPANSKEASSLQQIALAAERAAHLTRQLLTFSRKQLLQPVVLDPNQLIEHMADMMQRTVGESIAVHFSLAPNLPHVEVDPVMLEQVILNLAVNSRDAMPKGGQLLVSTQSTTIDENTAATQPDANPGPHVLLKVTDTGSGIPPDTLPHIFEPFFTTKEVGKGTGLGLATVYGIVKQHRGWISVASELNRGTVFQIYLPAVDEIQVLPDITPTPQETQKQSTGHETILVVEDEPALRELVRNILEFSGYSVLEAPSGRAALDVWRQHHASVDLLLTDVVMPDGVNGHDLALRLQKDKPSLKVLYTSGYGTEIVGIDFTLSEEVNFLQKPYNPRGLADAVRRCLDSKIDAP